MASSWFTPRVKKDGFLVLVSIIAAVALAQSGVLSDVFLVSGRSEIIGILVAGLLFTSVFTTSIGIAMFLILSQSINIFLVAGIGAAGSVVGDTAIFLLARYAFQDDVRHVLSVPRFKRFFAIFHRRMFRWVLPFVGALIIASPLPDELGLGLMGVSHMKLRDLMLISFVMNFIGIFLLCWLV